MPRVGLGLQLDLARGQRAHRDLPKAGRRRLVVRLLEEPLERELVDADLRVVADREVDVRMERSGHRAPLDPVLHVDLLYELVGRLGVAARSSARHAATPASSTAVGESFSRSRASVSAACALSASASGSGRVASSSARRAPALARRTATNLPSSSASAHTPSARSSSSAEPRPAVPAPP
mmetsp:Transcript_24673/g.61279  ORF Transcript_24673/g.61279 Transcript_24673/m.61279 type:complete len:180 (+) Transcript_24673:121-660(+)